MVDTRWTRRHAHGWVGDGALAYHPLGPWNGLWNCGTSVDNIEGLASRKKKQERCQWISYHVQQKLRHHSPCNDHEDLAKKEGGGRVAAEW